MANKTCKITKTGLKVVEYFAVPLQHLPRYRDASIEFKPLYFGYAKSKTGAGKIDVTFVALNDAEALRILMGIPSI